MCSVTCSKEAKEKNKEENKMNNMCKFCKHEIVDGLMIYKDKIPIAHYSCFRKSNGVQKR